MRLFIAIELAPETKQAVVSRQQEIAADLRRQGAAVRLTPESQLHLTLVFIGEVKEPQARSIMDVLAAPLPTLVFDMDLATAGVFPPRGRPRILWLGVERSRDRVLELYGLVSARLATVGVPREERPYSPHLTIGRWPEGDAPRRVDLPPASTRIVQNVHAVTLFESRLHADGARHTPLVRCALNG